MMHVMEAQQELVTRLADHCRAARHVPTADALAAALDPAGESPLVELMRAVYPYSHGYAELPTFQRELLLERVCGALGRAELATAPRRARSAVAS